MILIRAALLAAFGLLPVTLALAGEDITLTSPDGVIELSGKLLGYDGDVYRITSEFGVLSIDGDAVVCAGPACPEPGQYVAEWRISGARPGVDILVPVLLEAFARKRGLSFARDGDPAQFEYTLHAPDSDALVARIGFHASTASEGFADLAAGDVDIAAAAREPDATELARASEAGNASLQSRLLALDALVAVVGDGSGRTDISPAGLAALIGNPGDTPVHLPARGTHVSRLLSERLLVPAGTAIAEAAVRHADPGALATSVAEDPSALGVTLLSDAETLRPLAMAGTCGSVISADAAQIKAEDYPLTVPHYLYVSGRRLPKMAREFLAFTTSADAQDTIRAAGFIDQTIGATPLTNQGDRLTRAILGTGEDVSAAALRRMVQELNGAARLTPTFRFNDGSAELDAPSRANIVLVAAAIADGAFRDAELLVAGFSDGLGGGAANLALSAERASAVRRAIEAAVPPEALENVSLVNEGFGEALPIACDEEAWGRSVNRRVELWLRQR